MPLQRDQTDLVELIRLPLGGSFIITNEQGKELFRVTAEDDTTRVEGEAVTGGPGGGDPQIVISESDPGAIGAGRLWLEVTFADQQGDNGYGRLWFRNSTDDGWNSVSPTSYSETGTTYIGSPDDHASIDFQNQTSNEENDSFAQIRAGNKSFTVDKDGVHIGGSGDAALRYGGDAPTEGDGVVAVAGSLYLCSDGTVWVKNFTGEDVDDTAWSLLSAPAPSDVIKKVTVVLDDAAIKDLPVTLLAGQAGKIYLPIGGYAISNIVAPYTNLTNLDRFGVGWDGSGVLPLTQLLEAEGSCALLVGSEIVPMIPDPSNWSAGGLPASWHFLTGTGLQNVALVLFKANDADGDFTGGDPANTLTITVLYHEIDVA